MKPIIKTPTTSKIYKDINLFFTPHPATGDVTLVTNEEAIKRSIKHLVLTSYYDRPFEPEIGSRVLESLFENKNIFTEIVLKQQIEETITNYEPRVKLIDVLVSSPLDDNEIQISVYFEFQNIPKEVSFNLDLERVK